MRVFVTGVSSGIGRELVKNLISSGHQVWGVARRADALESLADELSTNAFRYDVCDVSDVESCKMIVDKMTIDNYLPDIVVLNAALDLEDDIGDLDFAKSSQMLRTNVDGAYYWITEFIDLFARRGTGQFVAISSLLAQWPDSSSVSYSASKAALSMLMRGLRLRYSDTRLQFKVLYLGPVDTQINPRFTQQQATKSMFIASADTTASYIVKMLGSDRTDFYYPFYIYWIFFLLRWLPDRWFQSLTSPFKR